MLENPQIQGHGTAVASARPPQPSTDAARQEFVEPYGYDEKWKVDGVNGPPVAQQTVVHLNALLAVQQQRTPGLSDSDADVDVDYSGQSPPLRAGALVLVEGLVKLPAYNGRNAVVEDWDEVTGRYSVLISCPSGCQQAKVKAGNLRAIRLHVAHAESMQNSICGSFKKVCS
jgi:hypothetical protein